MSEKLKKKIVDVLTGEETWLDLTAEEIAEVDAARTEAAKIEAENKKAQEAKAALLEKLGITEDEAKLLLS
jgi:hypothetical protein